VTRVLVALTLMVVACAPPGADLSATGSPSAIASLAPSASPSPTTSPSATTSPFAEAAAGTEWPAVVVYTVTADGVAHRIDRTGTTDLPRICDGQPVGAIARADGEALLVRCDAVSSDEDAMAVLDLASGRVTRLASRPFRSFPVAWSPDGGSLAYFRLGNCPMPAPVCQTRGVIADVGTGAEREILPSDYHLGTELAWTSGGLRMFQPECAEAGCFPPERVGTFLWDGTRFNKVSDLRLVASDGAQFSLYERLRSLSDPSGVRNVILRDGQTEQNLTAVGPREFAIDLLGAGHALAWRPDDADTTGLLGTLREYDPHARMLWNRPAKLYPRGAARIGDTVVSTGFDGSIYLYDLQRVLRFAVPIASRVFAAVKR